MFHIFQRPTREFPGRIDPSEGFRERRRRQRRRVQRRRVTAILVVVGAAVALTFGFRAVTGDDAAAPSADDSPESTATAPVEAAELAAGEPGAVRPTPVRGVHVTMALLTLTGKLDEYLSLTSDGLNTLQVDVKDEQGRVAFSPEPGHLAEKIGAVGDFYDPAELVRKANDAGVFLVARLVVFQDPILALERPKLSVKRRGGGNWQTYSGLGWTNPHAEAVWAYNVDIAEAAAEAGFKEIMFDYVRFPTDGDLAAAVYRGERPGTQADTITRFLAYAKSRLDPLDVEVGAAVFGLAATRNMGIGQSPKKMARHLDIVHPMVYPDAYGSGECNIPAPSAAPGQIVSCSLQDFRQALSDTDTAMIPWLQDYGGYGIDEIRSQVAASERWQSDGYLLWNGEGVYTPGALSIR